MYRDPVLAICKDLNFIAKYHCVNLIRFIPGIKFRYDEKVTLEHLIRKRSLELYQEHIHGYLDLFLHVFYNQTVFSLNFS